MLSRIYYLSHSTMPDIYIGSTGSSLEMRLANHRSCARSGGTSMIHSTMKDSDPDQWQITLIEEIIVNSSFELKHIEQFWIDQIEPELNHYRASRQSRAEYHQQYHIAKRTVILERKRVFALNKKKV